MCKYFGVLTTSERLKVSSLSGGDMHPINGPNHKLLVWIAHPCHVAIHPSNDIDKYLLVFFFLNYLFIYL
jgi:hypothetical protein